MNTLKAILLAGTLLALAPLSSHAAYVVHSKPATTAVAPEHATNVATTTAENVTMTTMTSEARKVSAFHRFTSRLAGRAGDGGKSQLTALLLVIFVGSLGIHRFYLGYTWQGIVQLLTLGGLGIWTLIDFVRIITGSLKPKNGEYSKTL